MSLDWCRSSTMLASPLSVIARAVAKAATSAARTPIPHLRYTTSPWFRVRAVGVRGGDQPHHGGTPAEKRRETLVGTRIQARADFLISGTNLRGDTLVVRAQSRAPHRPHQPELSLARGWVGAGEHRRAGDVVSG